MVKKWGEEIDKLTREEIESLIVRIQGCDLEHEGTVSDGLLWITYVIRGDVESPGTSSWKGEGDRDVREIGIQAQYPNPGDRPSGSGEPPTMYTSPLYAP